MTTFAKNQIPDSVDTVEKLLAWSASILAELNSDQRIAVNVSSLDSVASAGPYSFSLQQTQPLRYVVTAYLPLDEGYRSGGNVWESSVLPLSEGVIPISYES